MMPAGNKIQTTEQAWNNSRIWKTDQPAELNSQRDHAVNLAIIQEQCKYFLTMEAESLTIFFFDPKLMSEKPEVSIHLVHLLRIG